MGRKKKADETPKAGDNLKKGLTDAQRQALHLSQHVPSYEKALAAKKLADADLKNVCKTIKSEGGSVKAVKLTIELRTPEGEEAFKARMAEESEVAAWNGVGIQLSMLDAEPAEDRAFGEGRRAGMKGEPNRPPYDPSVPQHKRWLEGYADGNAVMASGFWKGNSETTQGSAAH